jgi:hypothetical protein
VVIYFFDLIALICYCFASLFTGICIGLSVVSLLMATNGYVTSSPA